MAEIATWQVNKASLFYSCLDNVIVWMDWKRFLAALRLSASLVGSIDWLTIGGM